MGQRRVLAGLAPAGWQDPGFDDQGWTIATGLLVPSRALESTASSLFARARFDVDAPDSVRSLELSVAYRDGFIAYLNGRELTRRNVPLTPPSARPPVAHGIEPERIFLPLPRPGLGRGAAGTPLLRARDNLLAIEVRPTVARRLLEGSFPSVQFELAGSSRVRIVRGPYLISPEDGEISVAWETDLPARGRVHFGLEEAIPGAAVRQAIASKLALRQVVPLRGLIPGARYRYQVDVEGDRAVPRAGAAVEAGPGAGAAADSRVLAQSSPATFQSGPRQDQPLRFAVYGDMRGPGHLVHAQLVTGLLHERPALIVNTGDLVAVGSEESAWQRYFEITAALGATAPVVPALGNHEAYLGGAAKSWALFGLRSAAREPASGYTSFDWGQAHFVVLDSNHPDANQRAWLTSDLARARKNHTRAIFAVCHDGPWSHGAHGGSALMERSLVPVLAAAGTDVLFSGHDHFYERGTGLTDAGPLTYVVSGGGGAPLYDPTCQTAMPPSRLAKEVAGKAESPAPTPSSTLPACPPSVAIVSKNYHYVMVELDDRRLRICPRLPDGSPLEPCVDTTLRAAR